MEITEDRKKELQKLIGEINLIWREEYNEEKHKEIIDKYLAVKKTWDEGIYIGERAPISTIMWNYECFSGNKIFPEAKITAVFDGKGNKIK